MQLDRQHPAPPKAPSVLDSQGLKSLRNRQLEGISRRQLLAWSIVGAVGLWLSEVVGGTFGFLWPNLTGGFGGVITIGKITDAEGNLDVPGRPLFSTGAPARFPAAKLFAMLVDPSKYAFAPGTSAAGDGAETNVRTSTRLVRTSVARPTSVPRTSGSNAPVTVPATTGWGSRSRAWVPLRAASTGSGRRSAPTGSRPSTRARSPLAHCQCPWSAGLDPPASPTGCLS
jgi:hypothetical protein